MQIETVYKANRTFFGGNNKQFFGDIDYNTIMSASGKYYFINQTNMWSDMLGGEKVACYRLSELNQLSGKIGDLIDDIFADMQAVNVYLLKH